MERNVLVLDGTLCSIRRMTTVKSANDSTLSQVDRQGLPTTKELCRMLLDQLDQLDAEKAERDRVSASAAA